ncbi:hypothetical protein APHAL10511_008215 [Amanita phalloides]|nr:hypothetical protein APHAL10511_008215 [Amanita phalloides]
MGFNYIIEHMEEDDDASKTVPRWVFLEYSHMLKLAGRNSCVHFTHLSPTSCAWLEEKLGGNSATIAKAYMHQKGVMDMLDAPELSTSIGRVCLLDPRAKQELKPDDGDGRFNCFLFGGILGDDPPRDRTSELRVLGFPSRHLGPIQMTTDTAVGVTKLVVEEGTPLDKIRYVDMPTIRFNAKESIEMPFRYIVDGDGWKPLLPVGMRELLQDELNETVDGLT